MKRKLLMLVLILAMLLPSLMGEAGAVDSGKCGTNATWEFDAVTGTLTISGTGAMDDYYQEYAEEDGDVTGPTPWESWCWDIKRVVIGDNITRIGKYAFFACSEIEEVIIPDSVTSIGDSAFNSCDCLTELLIPDSVVDIEDQAFYYCYNLECITIPNSVTSIGGWAFEGCSSLAEVTIGNSVTTIGDQAFYGCRSLTTLTIPDSVRTIGDYAFCGCNLKNLTLGNGITSIGGGAFHSTKLTSVTIPESVTSIGDGAFLYCDALEEIVVDNNNTAYASKNGLLYTKDMSELVYCPDGYPFVDGTCIIEDGVSVIGTSAFRLCKELTNIILPNSVQKIENFAFEECSGLTEVTLPASIRNISWRAFNKCPALQDVYYAGTELYRESITVDSMNDALENATWHYGNSHEHSYGEWTQTTAATCTTDGAERRDCVECDHYETRAVVATGHSYGDWVQTVAPTVTAEGMEERTCGNCGEVETRSIPMLQQELTAPTIKASAVTSTGKTKLSWSAVSGADFYRVYRSTSRSSGYSYLKSTRSTSFTDTSAVAGTNYYYKVKAVVEETDETSAYSNIVNRCCDLAKPVVTLKVDTASGKPKVTFEKITGAEKYYIVRSTSRTGTYSKLATITGTSYIDTSAKAGTNYYYKVKALHAKDAADSAYSDITNRVCDLAKPTVSISYNSTSGKPVVKWETVEGAAKYYVYRSTSKSSGYEKVYTGVSARSYTDKTAEAGVNYYYKVRAIHTNSSANSAYSSVVNRVCDLAKPTVTLTLTASGNPWVKWKAVEDADGYEVWRATSKSGTYKKVKTTVSGTSFADRDATKGKTYYYKIRAIHDNTSANSAYSSIKSITAK